VKPRSALDETSFLKASRPAPTRSHGLVDLARGQLLDMVADRSPSGTGAAGAGLAAGTLTGEVARGLPRQGSTRL
jgi:hypothetical protein